MNIKLEKFNSYKGTITVPGSKSITHRALICASLNKNPSIIENANICEDTVITMNLLKTIGVKFEINNTTIKVIPPAVFTKPMKIINAKNSGSSIRFLIPIFFIQFREFKVQVDERMVKRLLLTKHEGIEFKSYLDNQKPIIEVTKLDLSLLINNPATSQYTSGILMSLFINQNIKFKIKDEIWNNPYVQMTIKVMEHFNKAVTNSSPLPFIVESDYSLASNFMIMGALDGEIKLNNFNSSIQGDKKIIDYLKTMNVLITYNQNTLTISKSNITNAFLDMSDTPDLIPIIASLMAVTKGISTITGFEKLPFKETNRLDEIINILNTLGSNIKKVDHKLIIDGTPYLNNPSYLSLPNDHRLIMMVLSISSRFTNQIEINGIENVSKSYPNFINDFLNCRRLYENTNN